MISLESQDPKLALGGVFCSVCTQSFLVIHNNTRYYILIRYLYMCVTVPGLGHGNVHNLEVFKCSGRVQ